ncbi:2Fe-2S iron-sulfur cluster-binding protein [Seonamhaeicola marinus]|uniref:2Fe-2S iron-sulfur cluster binding domain-containing protein n=1 Tax=Seonamhaeicola marinus TaxID=1912246 RepID=A0A5D0IRR7_9FLAO|nr:2Fe-2S iron-sulfur cluster-binding protein [Seonamhaeicola marinus]TYA84332.1 2Fe-2S iron-sulfur cluster binding domain-containing protein [Seonamhaeicola marinus]
MGKIIVIDSSNEKHVLKFKTYEYPNLMELIANSYYEDIGECRGRGLCGTCVVETDNEELLKEELDINERLILKQLLGNSNNLRLACQIRLTPKLNNSTFKVIDNY